MTKFDIKQTNIAKGVALLLLLWHHLFFNREENYNLFKSVFLFRGVPAECLFAVFCKVCVAIFLILSGYGLSKSYSSYQKKSGGILSVNDDFRYVRKRLFKLYSDYCFIYIIFVPMGLFFGRGFIEIYGKNPINYISDIFGVSYLIHNNLDYTMNPTWWYMSICVAYYILFPLLNRVILKLPETLLAVSFCLAFIPFSYAELNIWLFPFVLGMYIAKTNLFERISNALNNSINRLLFSGLLVVICAYARRYFVHNSVLLDGFFGVSIILFTYLNISRIPYINKALEELGKYSGMIFMFHSFIFAFYFKNFIYGFKYSLLIYFVMLIICYIIARLIEYLEHLIKYDIFIKRMVTVKNEKN